MGGSPFFAHLCIKSFQDRSDMLDAASRIDCVGAA